MALKNDSPRRNLDDLAEIHHGDAVGDVAHDAEIVGGEQHRDAELLTDIGEQFQDLRADRDVERGDRLVRDDHPRPKRERPRDRDPLALSAGELVRKAVEIGGGGSQAHQFEQPGGLRIGRLRDACAAAPAAREWCAPAVAD